MTACIAEAEVPGLAVKLTCLFDCVPVSPRLLLMCTSICFSLCTRLSILCRVLFTMFVQELVAVMTEELNRWV